MLNSTGPESTVPSAASGGGGAGLRPAGADTGQECEVTTWAALLGDEEPREEQEAEPTFFGRLRDSLGKSRRALTEQLAAAAFDPADDEAWERLEETLIYADVGAATTARIVERLETEAGSGELVVERRNRTAPIRRAERCQRDTKLVRLAVDDNVGRRGESRLHQSAPFLLGAPIVRGDWLFNGDAE